MIKALRTFRIQPSLPDELAGLNELAGNLRWAWDRPTRELFRWADPEAWEASGENPVELLGRLTTDRLAELADDEAFRAELARRQEDLREYLTGDRWAQVEEVAPPRVAYFSPEFGITHVMQTYSGGLGVLAGDHLKAASDLGLDLVGVGLLYRHGYFRQLLDSEGWQRESYPDLNPHGLPLTRLEVDGQPRKVMVRLADHHVACQIWRADVGRIPLLLLDTDLPENTPEDRQVTDKLYGGDNEHRLRQEIVLGIGGMRALDVALEAGEIPAAPTVYHSNEGHAGFLGLERVRRLITAEGLSWDEAIEASRASVLFTTHTPVPAGIDVFPRHLIERYFTRFTGDCGIDMDTLMALGQPRPGPGEHDFNMAVMGLRLSARANGVSQLHGKVARAMFAGLWPDLAVSEVPIDAVTNGVHAATWVGPEASATFNRHLPADWAIDPEAWREVDAIGDDELWRLRERARERLVVELRKWVRAQRERRGEPSSGLGWTNEVFDPTALTIGFARRFAEYKRGTLLLQQPERLRAMLLSTDRPVQFVFSGKAHPRDERGKDLIRQLVHFSADPEIRTRLVFLEDYDMDLARTLYAGVDVWLNNPRRPHEACGTSGEKAVLNGALHCSTLDGWWDELFDGANGFAIGAGEELADTAQQDAADCQALYELLEQVLVPSFYDRSEGPFPRRWLRTVRRSLSTLGGPVLATRMVQDYARDFYVPIAERSERLQARSRRPARDLARWRGELEERWPSVAIADVDVDDAVGSLGECRDARVTVDLGELTTDDVRVELLHGPVDADGALTDRTTVELELEAAPKGAPAVYRGQLCAASAGEYGLAVRVVPGHPDLTTSLELGRAVWAVGNGDGA